MPENSAPKKKKLNTRLLTAENCPRLVSLNRLKWGSPSSNIQHTLISIISAGISQLAKCSRNTKPNIGRNTKMRVNSNQRY